jgi:hypothetical protein
MTKSCVGLLLGALIALPLAAAEPAKDASATEGNPSCGVSPGTASGRDRGDFQGRFADHDEATKFLAGLQEVPE